MVSNLCFRLLLDLVLANMQYNAYNYASIGFRRHLLSKTTILYSKLAHLLCLICTTQSHSVPMLKPVEQKTRARARVVSQPTSQPTHLSHNEPCEHSYANMAKKEHSHTQTHTHSKMQIWCGALSLSAWSSDCNVCGVLTCVACSAGQRRQRVRVSDVARTLLRMLQHMYTWYNILCTYIYCICMSIKCLLLLT